MLDCAITPDNMFHFNLEGVVNPRRACAEGLQYLSCLSVCLLPLNRGYRSFLRST